MTSCARSISGRVRLQTDSARGDEGQADRRRAQQQRTTAHAHAQTDNANRRNVGTSKTGRWKMRATAKHFTYHRDKVVFTTFVVNLQLFMYKNRTFDTTLFLLLSLAKLFIILYLFCYSDGFQMEITSALAYERHNRLLDWQRQPLRCLVCGPSVRAYQHEFTAKRAKQLMHARIMW
jgi:hypothetical protein